MRPAMASRWSQNICTRQLLHCKFYSRKYTLIATFSGGLGVSTRQQRLLSSRQPRETDERNLSLSPSRPQQRFLSRSSGPSAKELSLLDTVWFPPPESSGPETLSEAELSRFLLEKLDNPRLSKVSHYKDRSTALKRAIQVACEGAKKRYGWETSLDQDGNEKQLGILKLEDSLFGDYSQNWVASINQFAEGAQETELQHDSNEDSYKIQGGAESFRFPCVKRKEGGWKIEPPKGMKRQFTHGKTFARLGDVFDIQTRLASPEALRYRHYFEEHLKAAFKEGRRFGAVLLEPILTGIYTKHFVDPLFQYIFIQVVRNSPQLFASNSPPRDNDIHGWTGLPIIFSETSGPDQRLGRFTSASLLQVQPDISLIRTTKVVLQANNEPTTLLMSSSFSQEFDAVQTKMIQNSADLIKDRIESEGSDAALLKLIEDAWGYYLPSIRPNKPNKGDAVYQTFREDWDFENGDIAALADGNELWSIWSNDFIYRAAQSSNIRSLMALGSVLTITVRIARPGNPKTGLTSDRYAALKDQILDIGGKSQDINLRCKGESITLWPKNDLDVDLLSRVQRLFEDQLLGNEVAALPEDDGMVYEV